MFADYQEKQFIMKVIADALALDPSPRVRLTAVFIGTDFPVRLKEGSADSLAIQAVNICLEDGYTNDPTWLYMLLSSFSALDKRIGEIMERIPNYKTVKADPLTQVILNNEIPFVNRSGFRNHILRLAEQQANTKPILVVTGEGKTGKR